MIPNNHPSEENQALPEENTGAQDSDLDRSAGEALQAQPFPISSPPSASAESLTQASEESEAAQEWAALDSFRRFPVASAEGNLPEGQAPEPIETGNNQETPVRKLPESRTDQSWSAIASFRLEFQTQGTEGAHENHVLVEHIEKQNAKTWAQLDDEGIYPWILKQVEDLEEISAVGAPTASQPTLEITRVRFLQPATVSAGIVADGQQAILNSVLRSQEPVALEVAFKLGGVDSSELARQALPYQIQGGIRNRMTGADTPLRGGAQGHLIADQYSYTVLLPEVTLSPGPYQLRIIITIEHANISPSIFEVPILQVI
jgi:hypothetical protein